MHEHRQATCSHISSDSRIFTLTPDHSQSTMVALSTAWIRLAVFAAALASPSAAASNRAEALNVTQVASGSAAASPVYTNARMTFYEVGVGACGFTNKDTDYVSARLSSSWADNWTC